MLIDKYEIAARRTLGSWFPQLDGAILVGHPWSPLAPAARRLAEREIPYIVDVGDPWVLTGPYRAGGWLQRARAMRAERELWTSARGVIVTTKDQGDELCELFPGLRVLVRPNGYITPANNPAPDTRPLVGRELRLVHYGTLHGPRTDLASFLETLTRSGTWDRISLHQYGPDWEDLLSTVPSNVQVSYRSPISWPEVMAGAHDYHAALVIGWRNGGQMPSKTVQYLTLPIPRVAIVNAGATDALTTYLADKQGWAVIADRSPDAPSILTKHLAKPWTSYDLQPPLSESWEAVERTLGAFATETLRQPAAQRTS